MALLSDCVIGDNTDMQYSDPPLIHQLCGEALCTVEPGDSIETLASLAREHECEPVHPSCDGCGAEAGEDCQPMCIGEAAEQDRLGVDLTEEARR
jgi:hypothetical protein